MQTKQVIAFFILLAGSVLSSHLSNAQTAKSQSVHMREKVAISHLRASNYNKVVDLLNPNTDLASGSELVTLAWAYHHLNDYSNLVRILSLLYERNTSDHQVRYMLADANLKLAKTLKTNDEKNKVEAMAVGHYRGVIQMRKSFRPAYDALINYFLDLGANHETREMLHDKLKAFGTRPDTYNDLCRLYTMDGYLPQAIKNCKRAIQISPGFADNYVYLAQSFFDQKNTKLAEDRLVFAAQKFTLSEYAQFGAGSFYFEKKNYPVAEKYFSRAVSLKKDSPRAQIGLAKSLFEAEKYDFALNHFAQACTLDSKHLTDVMKAASRLRQKGLSSLSQKYMQIKARCHG